MCGIAGAVSVRGLDPARLAACLELMRRRGPDHAAHRVWTTPLRRPVYLLHTRLRIIDLEARADQPFHLGTKWLIYNGELYNYLELRRDLEVRGHAFATESDTEVLLATIEAHGWEGLDRCEGMWALAVYDEADGSLTLARDRFGEKPLYVFRDESGFYFGSEVKFIAALLGRRLDVNIEHLYRYLVNGYKALYKSSHTFFRGVNEVPPASLLRLDADGTEARHGYWRLNFCPNEALSYEDAVAGARERLVRAVGLRLRADVPLAFCMSGGVDSNALIGIAKNVFDYDVHGFTIVNQDARYDEREMVEEAVRALGIRHTAIPVRTDGFLDGLRVLVRQHDAPVYTISYYAHWLLLESIAAHGYRIAVSGTAADELFTGYYDHHLAYLCEVHAEPALYEPARQAWLDHVRPLVRNPHLKDADLFCTRPDFREHIFLDAAEFATYLRADWAEPFHERTLASSLLRNRMLNELLEENVPVILHEDDLNAMYYSVENRSPYLDRALVEFCFRIPTRHLIREGYAKAVLREAVRGIAPDAVLNNRRKVGFNAPVESFLAFQDPNVRSAVLDDGPIFDHVHRDRIEALLGRNGLPNSRSKFLFSFLAGKMFLEEFAA